ncbi:MAG TPA: general stress protein 13 [Metalysinibacillus jejuensis]|uniref:General stress protein 13 n=1 Tax=Metalysinibacillus jejuensis TaxID=914327 RepID=A0A921N945_9BACL|nr:S1 domain-containing post-transcriptional regulator GSP13 [Metalysinibacillus jejuensis]HJH10150.1 general stress protein 13 [Metalysinibacillus jejuensis]
MSKKYEVGDIVVGTVTGVQPYGAFIALDEHTQGLVHISEITYGFVKNVADFLSVGDTVKVKILEVDRKAEKISLSIRALQERPPAKRRDGAPRKSLQDRVDEIDANGFNSLRNKMQDWIDESGF